MIPLLRSLIGPLTPRACISIGIVAALLAVWLCLQAI